MALTKQEIIAFQTAFLVVLGIVILPRLIAEFRAFWRRK